MDAKPLRNQEQVRDDGGANQREPHQNALRGELQRLKRVSLADECAKLDLEAERAEAEQWLNSEAAWPITEGDVLGQTSCELRQG